MVSSKKKNLVLLLLSWYKCMGDSERTWNLVCYFFPHYSFLGYWGLPLGPYFVLTQLQRIHHDSLVWQRQFVLRE